jgi:hypothetical protein
MIKLKSTSKTNPSGDFDDVVMDFRASVSSGRDRETREAIINHIEPVWNEAIAMINQAIDDCLQSDFVIPKVEALR